jgi:heterodisulfide reductase subunit C
MDEDEEGIVLRNLTEEETSHILEEIIKRQKEEKMDENGDFAVCFFCGIYGFCW